MSSSDGATSSVRLSGLRSAVGGSQQLNSNNPATKQLAALMLGRNALPTAAASGKSLSSSHKNAVCDGATPHSRISCAAAPSLPLAAG
jgi:hypothetical protein